MYRSALTAGAEARFWALVRDRLRAGGIAAPDALGESEDVWSLWRDPALVLGQTCGMPYRTQLHGVVTLVGTPDYGLEGCPPGYYRSVVVAREAGPLAALADQRFAYNEAGSQSGWAALANEAPEVVGGARIATGSHRASVAAVQDGRADFAAVDAVTWRLIEAEGKAEGLVAIHRTEPTPGLPYIASRSVDGAVVFDAVSAAIAALDGEDRAALGLRGLVAIPAEAYLAVPVPAPPA